MQQEQTIQQRKNLDEVSFIRPILIVLLVLYHAFAPWCGAWEPFTGFEENITYWWIAKGAYSFMLPVFVFVSGYVWAYQREVLNRKSSLKSLVIKKFKRLYFPSVVFSILYYILFYNLGSLSVFSSSNLYSILNGYAHMWFLPMLFWIFILAYLILSIPRRRIRWCIVLMVSFVSLAPMPFRINTACNYLIYFYAGYEVLTYYRQNIMKKLSAIRVVVSWIVFLLSFVFLTLGINKLMSNYADYGMMQKVIILTIHNILTKIYGLLGVISILYTALFYIKFNKIKPVIIQVGSLCFGVYIFQQFILEILYYHCIWIESVEINALPWVSFYIAMILSMLLTLSLKSTRIGRKLI